MILHSLVWNWVKEEFGGYGIEGGWGKPWD